MQDAPQANSAIDAIRCVYLARVAEQEGYHEAARRWQQMAARWLNRLEPHASSRPDPPIRELSSVETWLPDLEGL